MPDPRWPRVRPGDPTTAITPTQYNARNAEIERIARLSVGGGLGLVEGPGGRTISHAPRQGIWGKLSGTANPYAFSEVIPDSTGAFAALPGGYSGDGTSGGVRAYEVNAVANLNNKVIWLEPGYPGDWRGQYVAGGGDPGGITVTIPGCYCTATPATLALTVTYGPGEDAHTYSNAYQSCTMHYYDGVVTVTTTGGVTTTTVVSGTIPPYMPVSAYTGAAYYSTTAWVDDQGFTDYFRLTCFATQYALGFGQNNQGIWQAPGQIYNWSMGGRPAVNECSPFSLVVGRPQSGIFFNGRITIVG